MKKITFLFILLLTSSVMNAQELVSGFITNNLEPLAQANVKNLRSRQGAVSTVKGEFSLSAEIGDTLMFSYVGYQPSKTVVKDRRPLQILLEGEALDEVILTAPRLGYCRYRICCGMSVTVTTVLNRVKPQKELRLFPNASNGLFNLAFEKQYKQVEIVVYSMSGQAVLVNRFQETSSPIEIDISRQPSGIYIINAMVEGETIASVKAIKN